ncbi:hypothetical protein FZC76_11600 [Sutcliffiella horikoshii]|uniref:Uncharacterized protein n=1 Tax=Sutcliffiella horikoshii TaxID=79883 RepID=A0A5D4SZF9_9BACI|nr:hypothetical protein FZC76_11600 [Sutcliffiella horikoshii]
MLSHFLRAMYRCQSIPCPAGGRDRGDPTGEAEEPPVPPAESEEPATEINKVKIDPLNLRIWS